MASKETKNVPLPKDAMTYSRISSYNTCPHLEYYQYMVNGRGVESTTPYMPFIEGDFGHYAVAMFYKTGRMLRANLIKRADKTLAEIRKTAMITQEMDEDLRTSFSMMVGAASGYRDKYAPDLEKYEVLFVEKVFEFQLGEHVIQGKIDRGLKDKKTGHLMSWETKWVGGITQGAYAALPMSLQDLIYVEGFKAIVGEYPHLRCRDYIQKSRLRLKKSQANMETFIQYETRVQQQYKDELDKMFWRPPPQLVVPATIKRVQDNLMRLLDTREKVMENPHMTFNCSGMFGQPCQFVNACIAKLEGNHDGWNAPECKGMFRLKKDLHPELQKGDDDDE